MLKNEIAVGRKFLIKKNIKKLINFTREFYLYLNRKMILKRHGNKSRTVINYFNCFKLFLAISNWLDQSNLPRKCLNRAHISNYILIFRHYTWYEYKNIRDTSNFSHLVLYFINIAIAIRRISFWGMWDK